MTIALPAGRERLLLLTLAGIQFTHILDFMIMMPLGPLFTKLFAISDAQFGLLVSAYTFSAGASGLLAAFYVDRFGRKKLLLVLYVLFALATLACGLAGSYGALMVARVAAGAFGGVLSAMSQTIVGDVVPFERRGRATGLVMASFSVATVAGVPLSLFLAAHWGWHAPFFAIAGMSALFAAFAAATLPPLTDHLRVGQRASPLAAIRSLLTERRHVQALAFSVLLVFAAFTVIPYLTIYFTSNGALTTEQLPYIYLFGGAATLLTSQWIGRIADHAGKVRTFRVMALVMMVPLLAVTLSAKLPVARIIAITTVFFICMNGRMVPGMAILTSAAQPALRGTFMALSASIQSAAMGVAAYLGGLLIARSAAGQVEHYWANALVGIAASAASIWLVGRLHLYGQAPAKTAMTVMPAKG